MKNLNTLNLNETGVGAEILPVLDKLESLKRLFVRGADIDDDAVETLAKLKNLQYLNIEGTRISSAGVDRLKQSLKNCTIRHSQ